MRNKNLAVLSTLYYHMRRDKNSKRWLWEIGILKGAWRDRERIKFIQWRIDAFAGGYEGNDTASHLRKLRSVLNLHQNTVSSYSMKLLACNLRIAVALGQPWLPLHKIRVLMNNKILIPVLTIHQEHDKRQELNKTWSHLCGFLPCRV